MNSFIKNKAFWLIAAFAVIISSNPTILAQTTKTKPLFQDIPIAQPNNTKPTPAATPLVTKTGSSTALVARKTSIPALMDVAIPGITGILVESQEGNIVLDSNSDLPLNPASNVKIATAYAVLKTFGPDYRFPTSVWTDGQIDRASGTLYGNLYVSGRDPVFNLEHGVALANELNRQGIRSITGDLIVTDNFVMNYSGSAQKAVTTLQVSMDASKRSAAAAKAWQSYLVNSGKIGQVTITPSVSFTGGVYVQSIPTNAKLLFSHESTPMREIVKATLCYSNNYLAERLGDMVGGPYAVARFAQLNAGISPAELFLATSSGLGINRVTPRAMMKVLRALQKDLAKNKMTFADIMPVAGMDQGTLENRFDTDFARGSVVGKTGTLGNTDGGASALAGEMNTRNGKVLFVIFNQRGSVPRFRTFQNSLVSLIQSQLGGPVPLNYKPISLDVRMANTRITYPDTRQRISE
ncbi:MAG TPA: D-alanyl-D-alanine carboxypeptidase [Pyrinomonadaceae bacterium]|jgi:D-alanyl-D-alanine carboxypeptidase/D-alanyl-D-alanine-endopeptidase (penicillin-binding protein 4)